MTVPGHRRILVGTSEKARSTVVADARDLASSVPLPGFHVQEVWCQSVVPGSVCDAGHNVGELDLEPPTSGALVRILTVDPVDAADWVHQPHRDENRHVLTLISGRIDLVLDDGEHPLAAGDSVVLAGDVHDWRNTYGETAVLVYTTFPLTDA